MKKGILSFWFSLALFSSLFCWGFGTLKHIKYMPEISSYLIIGSLSALITSILYEDFNIGDGASNFKDTPEAKFLKDRYIISLLSHALKEADGNGDYKIQVDILEQSLCQAFKYLTPEQALSVLLQEEDVEIID